MNLQTPRTEAEAKFRSDAELVAQYTAVRRSPLMMHVLSIVQFAHPIRQGHVIVGESDKATLVGFLAGYQEVLNLLERLETPTPQQAQPTQSTFGVTDEGEPEQQE